MKAILLTLLLVPLFLIGTTAQAQEDNLSIQVKDLGHPPEIAEKYKDAIRTTPPLSETVEVFATVEVKIPHAVSQSNCTEPVVNLENLQPTTYCAFVGNEFVTAAMPPVEDPSEETIPEVEEEPFPLDENGDGVISDAEKQKKIIRNTIERLQEDCADGCDTSEQDHLDLLSGILLECQRGLGGTATFQTYGTWIVPGATTITEDGKEILVLPHIENPRSSLPIKGTLYGDMMKDYRECVAQQTLQSFIDSTHYPDIVVGAADVQPYHADLATVQATITDRKDGDSRTEEQKAWNNAICNNDNLKQQTKELYGCPKPVFEGTPIGDNTKPIKQGPRSTVEAAVIWQDLSCGIAMEPVVNDRYLRYIEEMAERWTCDVEWRTTGLTVFNPRTADPLLIEEWIAWYEDFTAELDSMETHQQ